MKTLTFSGLSPQNTLGRQRSKADRSPYENYPLPLRGSQSPRTHIKTILPNNQTENNANEIYQVIKSKISKKKVTWLNRKTTVITFEVFLLFWFTVNFFRNVLYFYFSIDFVI